MFRPLKEIIEALTRIAEHQIKLSAQIDSLRREADSGEYIAHKLGTITLKEVPPLTSGTERADRASKIAIAHSDLKAELEAIMHEQTVWMVTQAPGTEQFLFGRGTINGLLLALEMMDRYKGEHEQNIKDAKEAAEPTEDSVSERVLKQLTHGITQ